MQLQDPAGRRWLPRLPQGFRAAGGTGGTFDGFALRVLFFAFECCAKQSFCHGHPSRCATYTPRNSAVLAIRAERARYGVGLGTWMSVLSGMAGSASRTRSMQARAMMRARPCM